MNKNLYILPQLPYPYDGLEPCISSEIMTLHHQKHHKSYVDNANKLLEKIWEAREKNLELDFKSVLKSLSFNVAGHTLHCLFWVVMAPTNSGKNQPSGKILEAIENEFGSFNQFKKEFSQAALSVEGSGWAALTYDKENDKLLIMQMEKHNLNYYPEHKILLPLDVWEHAYYLDYKNDRVKYIESWWEVVNWEEVEKRFII